MRLETVSNEMLQRSMPHLEQAKKISFQHEKNAETVLPVGITDSLIQQEIALILKQKETALRAALRRVPFNGFGSSYSPGADKLFFRTMGGVTCGLLAIAFAGTFFASAVVILAAAAPTVILAGWCSIADAFVVRAERAIVKFKDNPVPEVIASIQRKRAVALPVGLAEHMVAERSLAHRSQIIAALNPTLSLPAPQPDLTAQHLQDTLGKLSGKPRADFLDAVVKVVGPALSDAEKNALYVGRARLLDAEKMAEAAHADLSRVEDQASRARRYVETALLPDRNNIFTPIK